MAASTERDPRLDRVTPRAFYDAYPMSNLLGIEASDARCKPKAFLNLLVDGDCSIGDHLFIFLGREIFSGIDQDEPTVDELIGRLMTAKDDIDAVIKWLEGL